MLAWQPSCTVPWQGRRECPWVIPLVLTLGTAVSSEGRQPVERCWKPLLAAGCKVLPPDIPALLRCAGSALEGAVLREGLLGARVPPKRQQVLARSKGWGETGWFGVTVPHRQGCCHAEPW